MSSLLSQSRQAGFPDRPATEAGGWGLRIDLSAGQDAQVLTVPLASPVRPLHVRLMIRPVELAGGTVVLMRGCDDQGLRVADLRYDASSRTFSLVLPGPVVLAAPLPSAGPDWSCLEWFVDGVAGTASLRLNGRLAQSTDGLTGLSDMVRVLLGVVARDAQATGRMDVDELVIADEPIGPVVVQPAGPYADQPAAWLVLYNTADADSCTWAQAYRAARRIPYANLCGLDLPAEEVITAEQFDLMRQAVAGYLEDNFPPGHVLGLLLGHGVPGYYTDAAGQHRAIADQLHRLDPDTEAITNPLSLPDPPARPDAVRLEGGYLVGRIDGPTLADSLALVERAANLENNGLGDGAEATVWFDPVNPGPLYQATVERWQAWADSPQRQALLLPFEQARPDQPDQPADLTAIHHDGFFWGWPGTQPPDGFFAEPPGRRVFCFQADDTTATSPTLRDLSGGRWTTAALQAGYAMAAGSSRPYSLTGVPDPGRFFQALRDGWTLAEAWAVACPLWREGLELVGDPLLRLVLPRAGWQVFGPFEVGQPMPCDEPAAVLRADQTTWTVTEPYRPAFSDRPACYGVVMTDDLGRPAAGGRVVAVQRVDDVLVEAAPLPAWPNVPDWPARWEGEKWQMVFVFAGPARSAGACRLELVEQVAGQDEQVVEQRTVGDGQWMFVFERPVGPTARYRLRVETGQGARRQTPWSQWLTGATVEGRTVELLTR